MTKPTYDACDLFSGTRKVLEERFGELWGIRLHQFDPRDVVAEAERVRVVTKDPSAPEFICCSDDSNGDDVYFAVCAGAMRHLDPTIPARVALKQPVFFWVEPLTEDPDEYEDDDDDGEDDD